MSTDAAEFWEDFYAAGERWSGHANALLVAEVAGLPAGVALDVGCGEGGDAIWLATQGWRVTAVDIATSALESAARHAAAAGVGDAITWERHDLEETLPTGTFDLVASSYLHSKVAFDRPSVLRAAARLVRPGGTLVIVGHAGSPSWAAHDHGHAVHLPSAAEVVAGLALGAGWDVERCADVDVPATDPDGAPGTRRDCVVRAHRRIDDTAGDGGTA